MYISRTAPERDHGSTMLASMKLGLLNTDFQSDENDEDASEGFVRIHLHTSGLDRLFVSMSPYEVILAFATLPTESIGKAANEFFSHFQDPF